MKKDQLESFITENRTSFDVHSPSPDLWEKLNTQIHQQKKKHWSKNRWLQIAAVFAVIVFGSAIVMNSIFLPSQQLNLSADADSEVRELIEAEAYYAQQVNGKMKEIRKCYKLIPELQMEVENDLIELEDMYKSLRLDLKENFSSKEVIEAMIENNRYRMKLVDEVLEQINC